MNIDRSHEDHGTKLTNVVSKFNELTTRDGGGPGTQGSCRHLVAAERAEGDVPIGDGGGSGCAYRGSALSPRSGVLAKWKGQWLPTGGRCHWSFSIRTRFT